MRITIPSWYTDIKLFRINIYLTDLTTFKHFVFPDDL